ncbi:hypothetical protein BGZ68_010226 [Mortierella alpina]|nr:hypothetical protein BGZ68_010226 [Mortierella alpina]
MLNAKAPTHPLLLPEVLQLLGRHLVRPALLVSLRVCSTWHHALQPCLWSSLHLENQPCNFTPRQATPTVLLRNKHHIRHLHEIGSNSLLKFLAFSTAGLPMQLTSIHVSMLTPEILMVAQQNVDTLVSFSCRANRLRKDLQAQSLWYRQLFLILEMAPRLQHLSIGPAVLLDSPTEIFGATFFQSLKSLELDRIKLADPRWYAAEAAGAEPEPDSESARLMNAFKTAVIDLQTFPRLETLILIWNDLPPQCQLELIRKAPNLRSLTWRRCTKLLADSWLSSLLPIPANLTRLDVAHSHISDEDMERLLVMMPGLTALNVRSKPFGLKSCLRLLQNQARGSPETAMVELDLVDCSELSSAMIQKLMSCLPKLKVFGASRLEAGDIVDAFMSSTGASSVPPSSFSSEAMTVHATTAPDLLSDFGAGVISAGAFMRAPSAPWTCLTLESLELSIVGLYRCDNPGPTLARDLVYEQLAQLVNLRVLILGENVGSVQPPTHYLLDWTLPNGLDKLARLTRLEELDIRGLRAKMGMKEVQWVAHSWQNLRKLTGGLCYDANKNELKALERELKTLRPDVVRKGREIA